ncbi:P2Y purinoceptor 8 [Denticeps clupeoides]|uniref:G-protein coupled receptors family 1 profile domain-containing protein n=1 Tax=Denticeps clupeoides TaxID=299321 RepID=A0AAY4EDE3_9TELE|nr:P2Y purinoceptor 8 [Denticeps clupeoides]
MSWMSNTTQLDNATLAMFKDRTFSHFVSAVYVVVILVNFVSNGLSLWLLVFRTSPKTPTIVFMINLTLTDLAMASVLPFQITYQMNGYDWTLGSDLCNLLTVVFYANMYCSILTMTAISIDRYLGIVKPLLFREIRENTTYAVVCCMVMWGVVLAVLYPMESTDLTFKVKDLNITTCFDVLKKDMLPSLAAWALVMFVMFVALFLIPFLVTIFCYVSIIWKLSKDAADDQKSRAIRLAFTVLFVFIVCFAPNNILLIAHAMRRLFHNKSLYMAYKISLLLSCLNSCLDPFIYYFACREFRNKLRRMLNLRALSSTDHTLGHKDSIFSSRSPSHEQEEEILKCLQNGQTSM